MKEIIENNTIQILDKSLSGGFSAMPRIVLKAKRLTMQAKTLYALLLDYAWQEDKCFPGQDRLAEDLDVHKNTILKYLNELRNFGLIKWIQRGLNRTNIYYILPLDKLKPESQRDVIQELHSSVNHESQENVNIIDSALIDTDEYTQTLTLEEKLKTFDPEAVLIAKELRDLKNIKYYQSLINKKNKEFIKDEHIQSALNLVREKLSIQKSDGEIVIRKPGALFVKFLKEMIVREKARNQITESIRKLTDSKTLSHPEVVDTS